MHSSSDPPPYSVIIPTLNEREALGRVLRSLKEVRVVVVDDGSTDGTQEVVLSHGNAKLIERGTRKGLVSAYVDGMAEALREGYEFMVVMDGDGQHDPSLAGDMVGFAAERGADLVIGSRYIDGGIVEGLSPFRRLVSRVANDLFRLSFDSEVRDATSGYRVYSRRAAQYLVENPPRNGGYAGQVEIVEELHRAGMRIAEFPVKFLKREHGESKLKMRDILQYFLYVLRSGNLWKYSLVGISGVAVNELALYALSRAINPLLADAIAIEVSIASNFSLNEIWTFRGRRLRKGFSAILRRFYLHNAASLGGLAVNFVIFALLLYMGVDALLANLVGIAVAFAFRYLTSSGFVWSEWGSPDDG